MEARLTASVLAGPSIIPMPAPARMMYHCWVLKSRPVTFPAHSQNPTALSAQPSTTGPLGADPVEHPPADLRRDDEADEEVQDVEAGLRRRLAERDLGVLAGEEEHRDEHQHRDREHDVLDEERADAKDAHFDQRRRRCEARTKVEHDQQRRARERCRPGGRVAPAPDRATAGSRTRSGATPEAIRTRPR